MLVLIGSALIALILLFGAIPLAVAALAMAITRYATGRD